MFVMYHSDGSQWPAKQQNTMDGCFCCSSKSRLVLPFWYWLNRV